jgi:farnesyl-diphosphate farnesyltransferase
MSSTTWGKGVSQEEFMIRDECIVLNENDDIIGHGNKKDVHTFSSTNPRGILHRAFSVFLFNTEGKLLLQKRADEKITFPSVWTNTCCSHPLYGFEPNEVDNKESLLTGQVLGVKNAAIRKLEHELGIPKNELSINDFKFLTRLHYWAADVQTHGEHSPWGEHEIDYILFIQKDIKTIALNKEEVSDVKYVTLDELRNQMNDSSLKWSPWFRIIAEKFLPVWWNDLKETLTTDRFVDVSTIYRFDPTTEHMGGAGNAREWLGRGTNINYAPTATTKADRSAGAVTQTGEGNKGLKQGAYGKVKIHSHSKFDQFSRIDEVFAGLYFKYSGMKDTVGKVNKNEKALLFCNEMLGKVSRSFAGVIRQLPQGLTIDILIFYLALRALDTIEDDMTAFKGKEHEKIKHLCNFYQTGLVTEGWKMTGVGEGDEKVLLENYFLCVEVFKSLPKASQEVIADITRRMGEGMASYVSKDLGQGTVTIADYNLYCHYVAGLVGEGLSRLFYATGFETAVVNDVSKTLANTMGLFLQKTNIIRDYLEDYVDGRAFWPQEIWKQYSKSGDLGEFAKPESIDSALLCLNHLIMDALTCVPECVSYMSLLRTEEVFRFCAIPQVMAIATLEELYNNPKVFTGVVKIRRGLTAKMILDTTTTGGLHKWFYVMAKNILNKIPVNNPNSLEQRNINKKTREICEKIMSLTEKEAKPMICKEKLRTSSIFAGFFLAFTGKTVISSLLSHGGLTRVGFSTTFSNQPIASTLFFGSMAVIGSWGLSCIASCGCCCVAGSSSKKELQKAIKKD